MLAALVFASLVAQAEPAPVPQATPSGPAAPAPGEVAAEPPPRDNALGVALQLARRVAEGGPSVDPLWGFSIGGRYERRLLAWPSGIELGAALDFTFQHFGSDVVGPTTATPNGETALDGTSFTETTFALLPTAGCQLGRMRPFASAGGGIGLGYFSSRQVDLRPGTMRTLQPLGRASVGVDVAVSAVSALTFRADYTHTFTRPEFVSDAGQTYQFFGDLFNVGVGLLLRF